jgi:type I restriction enzyme S subunit
VEAQGSTNYAAIRPAHVLGYWIPLPALAEQRRVVARIDELVGQIQEARELRAQAITQATFLTLIAAGQEYDGAAQTSQLQRLEDLCFQITDGTHYTPQYVESGTPFLSVKDISGGHICFDDVRYITADEHATLTKRCKPMPGDILLTKIGTTGLAKVIDVERGFSIFVSLALLKPNPDVLDPYFAEYMLNSTRLRERSAQGTRGVGNQNLVLKFIREFPLPVPDLKEQRSIVAELDALRAQVESLKRVQVETAAELDALLPAILDRAFKGELV